MFCVRACVSGVRVRYAGRDKCGQRRRAGGLYTRGSRPRKLYFVTCAILFFTPFSTYLGEVIRSWAIIGSCSDHDHDDETSYAPIVRD